MNSFQKNPFMNSNTVVNEYNSKFNEKNKLEKIKMDMNKVKQVKPIVKQDNLKTQMTISDKIEALNNINR